MIAFLQGNFVQLTPAKLIVDVSGVGYEVNISLNTYVIFYLKMYEKLFLQ